MIKLHIDVEEPEQDKLKLSMRIDDVTTPTAAESEIVMIIKKTFIEVIKATGIKANVREYNTDSIDFDYGTN